MSENSKDLMKEGIEYGDKGDFQNAIKCFHKILEKNKDHEDAWMFSAKSWDALGSTDKHAAEEAVRCFDEVIRINNSNAEAWFAKGAVLSDYLGEPDKAFECFTKTLEIDKNHVGAIMNQGIILDHEGKKVDAIHYFKLALEIDPTNQTVWYNYGVTLAQCKLYEEALDCFTKSIELNNNHVNSWLSKSKMLTILGKEKDAKFYMDRYNELTKE